MRAAAQVKEFALLINSNHAILRQRFDQLLLIRIAQLAKSIQRFLAANLFAHNRQILGNDAIHFLLDLQQILWIQRMLQIHIIIEAILNYRTYSQLDFLCAE